MTNATAILAIRNEEACLANCLRHLIRNGLSIAVIDNGSTDASAEILRWSEFAPHIVGVWDIPFEGCYAWGQLLELKMEIANTLDSEWSIHVDADEMMHSYRPEERLIDALARIKAAGFNAANFDEFVFLPIDRDYVSDIEGFPEIDTYYFFEPKSPRLMRAWLNREGLSMAESGGHMLTGNQLRLAPESFALRHYLFHSQSHAYQKYASRVFAPNELNRGWHRLRAGQPRENFTFPPERFLKRLQQVDDRALDKSEPWLQHFWHGRHRFA